MKLDLGTS